MTLGFAGRLDRNLLLPAVDRVGELVARPQIERSWERDSSCEGMTVGGLTRHLVQQPATVADRLAGDPDAGAGAGTVGLAEHYARAAWANADLDEAPNTSIRDAANAEAASGHAAAVHALSEARARLAGVLPGAPATVFLPRQGWWLATDDFIVTRLMEMVVHADDLAVSVGLPTPAFGAETIDAVLRLLAMLSVRRHGEAALIRTLTRPQRASRDVTAF
ncbi:maleylpyruvate isomerase N-terminal domain-containing protein [Propionicicella superfundia]|uniref:maleylpyruvate isomerase N-terminal domain-containing protein n=1 Tax=Propionicicella superfundia TaxID=348582 RepID=UPI000422FAF1|nr:maleylpyruvate isomerase N-terminal domain-containing protein [Propionicicella superfundia]